jgi:pyruvate-ferredoxin/flavodoxin oxidoreductase
LEPAVKTSQHVTIEGNEAAAYVAHMTNEVIAIYPITPSSPMGEFSDQWSVEKRPNLWGSIPDVVEMQSEGGAAGAVHGALQAGALTTTFTASQGLLLMIPNMYKIAGELTPTVFHVAARSLACQALSIFGDHSDVMAVRSTGFGLMAANSVQEVMDFALMSQSIALESRVPILHFFDGFRTSHEINKIEQLDQKTIRAMIPEEQVRAHRARALSPDHPVIRGTSQNPDVYFQARETVNPYYEHLPTIIENTFKRFAKLTGRHYRLFDYSGANHAETVLVLMGSGAETASETINYLTRQGEKTGLIKVRIYRPFVSQAFIDALPPSVKRIAVLDRTKEPGADGEPLYKDIYTALADYMACGGKKFSHLPQVVGGRYGLSSKEFTPGMVKAVLDNLQQDSPKNHFTIGIHDDVSHTSLEWDTTFQTDAHRGMVQAVFYGLGSDGTVSANKNSIKIIGEQTDQYAQGYFVYDSKKAGAVTVSHLRFGPHPIRSSYLIGDNEASFVACHQPVFLQRYDMLDKAAKGAVFLLNSPVKAEEVWNTLPQHMQTHIIEKSLHFYIIDGYNVAQQTGMGQRINTIMQTCFFAISKILPANEAITQIKKAVEKTYGRKGKRIIERNFAAIDATLASLHEVTAPGLANSSIQRHAPVSSQAPDFIQQVTGEIIAGRGDAIPVSFFPSDGTYPMNSSRWEKRNLAKEIPVWDEKLCIHCGKCPIVCPHAAIRSKVFPADLATKAPASFKYVPIKGKEFADGLQISYQVAPEDCTGCGLCVDICPIKDKSNASRKALNMEPQTPLRKTEADNWRFFTQIEAYDRRKIRWNTIKGSMLAEPLFEFSGACVGCGETPYLKLASQLFGDRMLIANATGCSSIYGGNLPTTPWSTNPEGRGPAWSNSLFEDNAEFGFGFRLAVDQAQDYAQSLLKGMRGEINGELVNTLLTADQSDENGIYEQRQRVAELRTQLADKTSNQARALEGVADYLVRKSVWIVGGDGWAYDIGYGGLDHVLSQNRDINVLVLDTEVYSNTGGQASKATPRGAVAKFAAAGKPMGKKDLALEAISYGHVYVARVAYGAKDIQTLRTFLEAEAYPGPSLIIAYSPCIAHGIDLKDNHKHQKLAMQTGHWPLFRFDPRRIAKDKNPMQIDSKKPDRPLKEFIQTEARFSMLWRSQPQRAEELLATAQEEVEERYNHYQQLAGLSVKDDTVHHHLHPKEDD